ncbi:rhamnan synthesis F family protein [Variovorax fucosicus]|uniref:rhamnan synthesis F family protein n=1 Tax=Variovorax fucosicus TaxID=3053517 RepID=UPI0025761B0E|nr:rhamnan synthesis F family protein [Variovorax sp. J22G47]MDM0055814.1 rhamnan synthesis F family protein [Variovorax sp. J22G47]
MTISGQTKSDSDAGTDLPSEGPLVEALRAELAAVYASTSWRITAPLRAVRGKARPPQTQAVPEPSNPEVELIRRSGFFDEAFYPGAEDARAMGISPVEHYLTKGEAAGLAPSRLFDPVYYARRYDDVVKAGRGRLSHYLLSGKQEGRSARPKADDLDFPTDRLDPNRETVIVAVHEATRTGAAILAWNIIGQLQRRYNVIALLKRDGPITQALVSASCGAVILPEKFVLVDAELDALVRQFVKHYSPRYVVANSVETRYFVPSFERMGVPTVSLIHEFSSTVRPLGELSQLFVTGSQLVFSANIVAQSALDDYKSLHTRAFKVIPQGASALPPNDAAVGTTATGGPDNLGQIPSDDGSVWVVGIGTITMRKGVEFFIAAAASVQRMMPSRPVKFGWIGKCYWFDQPYLDYLNEQVKRSGVEASFRFLSEFEDLEPVYRRADICFLSSRLDPLPNITIDSALRGIPTVCFDEASGMAEILKSSKQTSGLVVPYLDAEAAARVIVELANHPAQWQAYSDAIRAVASGRFDMVQYVEAIDKLGLASVDANALVELDRAEIMRRDAFNPALYLGPAVSTMSADEGVRKYLHASRLVAPRGQPRTGLVVRRPLEGFHPLVYASDNPDYDEAAGEDPLAHYARTGFPEGRWKHGVIRPEGAATPVSSTLRVVVHAHFHYPELLGDFIDRIARNETPVDCVFTTTSEERAKQILEALSLSDLTRASVHVVPNKGRDIGPFLNALHKGLFANYDVIGHFHGKRSPHVDDAVGATWRDFLWGHLLGDKERMMDIILGAFASTPSLGLVFPEDPHLNDWDDNREIASAVAQQMGLSLPLPLPLPLPNHFDFPQGTMFWARPAALEPLARLGIALEDYPDEPVPIDGTLLHALERLIPFSATHAGFRYATTYVQELLR